MLSIDERIKIEKERLFDIFSNLSKDELTIVEGLIEQCAFMKIALEDLQKEIRENGVVDFYQNGANQSGKKQSAELQSYNQTMKLYSQIIEKLLKIAPVRIEAKKSLRDLLHEQMDCERENEKEREMQKDKIINEALFKYSQLHESNGQRLSLDETRSTLNLIREIVEDAEDELSIDEILSILEERE